MSTDAGFDQPAFCTKTLEGLILLTKYFVCNVFFCLYFVSSVFNHIS